MSDALVLRADASSLPLRDASVDLIVTSPPYFGQRSYKDDGEHYGGQIGSEPTPQEFLAALWTVTAECWRVLKPSGSMFVNLGDKRSQRVATRHSSHQDGLFPGRPELAKDWKRDKELGLTRMPGDNVFDTPSGPHAAREKSKMLLPHRFAIGCEDGAADPDGVGWIVRQDLVWSKPNGLPESVRDRTRDAHEYWFHLVKQGDYFSGVDEIREPHKPQSLARSERNRFAEDRSQDGVGPPNTIDPAAACDPLGALPRSVWEIATEPLKVPAHLGVDHFAAFPSEWPRRLILGWSPSAYCLECEEPRGPVIARARQGDNNPDSRNGTRAKSGMDGGSAEWAARMETPDTITGYACACPDISAPTRPAVVLDPFGGTGTTAMVARALGRFGISVDLSADYCRLARWRIFESGHGARSVERTNRDRQGVLL